MVKLNLKALQNTSDVIEEKVNVTQKETPVENTQTTTKETVNETDTKKKKISLRDISKTPVVDSTVSTPEIVITDGENSEVTSSETSSEVAQISKEIPLILGENAEEKTNTLTEIKNTKETPLILEEVPLILEEQNSIEEKKETVAILDGDTNCNIQVEEKTEIFGSYKGSFAKAEEVKEKTVEIKEIKKEIPTPNVNTNNTPLQTLSKNTKNKKIIFSAVISVMCIGVLGLFFTKEEGLKSSIPDISQETIKTPVVSEEIAKEVIVTKENTQNSIEVISSPNTNNIENTEIVKENNTLSVDNNTNSDKINKRLQNFLIKKYKTK